MKIALFASVLGELLRPELVARVARGAEERGFASLWMGEHVVELERQASRYPYTADGRLPELLDGGMAEPFTTLAFAAACTSRIRLGTGVCVLTQRNPVYLAKEVATLDRLSNGRVDLGLGIGWQRDELAACGVAWERRGARADEYIELMRTLWAGEHARFDGEFWSLPECRQRPRPLQQPHPPLHVGGESDAALRRAARLGQGWIGYLDPQAARERIAALQREARQQGRKPAELEITIVPLSQPVALDAVKSLRDAGATQVAAIAAGAAEPEPLLDALAEALVVPARDL